MERELNQRDKAGVSDAVLIEDFTNEDAFIKNLEMRFKEDLIYVSHDVMKIFLKFSLSISLK
jgi:hypothetical protein